MYREAVLSGRASIANHPGGERRASDPGLQKTSVPRCGLIIAGLIPPRARAGVSGGMPRKVMDAMRRARMLIRTGISRSRSKGMSVTVLLAACQRMPVRAWQCVRGRGVGSGRLAGTLGRMSRDGQGESRHGSTQWACVLWCLLNSSPIMLLPSAAQLICRRGRRGPAWRSCRASTQCSRRQCPSP